jgi:SsrA-binding protein
MPTEDERTIATNRKARHEYFVDASLEVGIALRGTEVKAVRAGMVSFQDAYASIENNELFLFSLNISPFEKGNIFNHDPRRTRKLLAHRREIRKLLVKCVEKGMTLIPLRIYLKGRNVKIELGLCRGKKMYDKREALKKEDARRQLRKNDE